MTPAADRLTAQWLDETERAARHDVVRELGWVSETILRLIATVRAMDQALGEIEEELGQETERSDSPSGHVLNALESARAARIAR